MAIFTQALRTARLDTPLGVDVLLLVRFSGEEAISRPFGFDLELQSERRDIDPAEILRKPVVVSWRLRDGSLRHVHGHISRFSQGPSDAQLTSYRAELVPWTHFLSLRRDCRIFQRMSVPDIVEAVFRGAGFVDFEVRCGARPEREYCVQYLETDLNFVQRLLEEEGIFYFFEHSSEKHTLIMADNPSHAPDCPPPDHIPVRGISSSAQDAVSEFEWENSIRTGSVTYRDYDHLQPNFTLEAAVPGQDEEVYEYWTGRYTSREEGERLARYRLQAEDAMREQAQGRSECRNLIAGHKFTLREHTNARANQQYLLTSVHHVCNNGEYRSDETDVSFDYSNAFTCIPAAVPFRPRRTVRKPLIMGTQTAVVVGPPGEEIYPDEHGRVKVQFHWDRQGQRNEDSSCWVRVGQLWAGQGWGAQFLPRVGHEVIVGFQNGDPDQPIILGSVYNARNRPPYELPANQAQSGIKTRSTPNGSVSNFNELRFDDKKGDEEVYLHAERTLRTVVEGSESHSVGGKRTTSIGVDENITVKQHRTVHVENGHETIVIHTGNHTLDVNTGHHTVNVKTGNQELNVNTGHSTLNVRTGNYEVNVNAGHATFNVRTGNRDINVPAGAYQLKALNVVIQAPAGIKLECGGSSITMTPAGITIVGPMVKINC
jgi:type VI secretion system secreted protein VgrG